MSPKKRARFGAQKGFQTSLDAVFLVCEGDANIILDYSRVNPKFCVKSISGANRAKFICGGSRLVRLLPWQQHNAVWGGCQVRRSRSFYT